MNNSENTSSTYQPQKKSFSKSSTSVHSDGGPCNTTKEIINQFSVQFNQLWCEKSIALNKTAKPIKRVVIAYSGGLDSSVLLHLMQNYFNNPSPQHSMGNPLSLCIFHVHHGLNKNADQWIEHCQQQAKAYDIECFIEYVNADKQSRRGPEASARDSRYHAFEDFLNEDDVLLQAHHANDQLETFFLRLMRGAGLKGLTAIPQYRTVGSSQLYRPLLSISRQALETYANYYKLTWVEDDSNQDQSIDRNYIRHSIIPAFAQRWENYLLSTQQTIAWLKEQKLLSYEVALMDLDTCQLKDDSWAGECIDYESFRKLSKVRAKNLLSHWLERFANVSLSSQDYEFILDENFSRIELIQKKQLSVEKNQHKKLALELYGAKLHIYFLAHDDWNKTIVEQAHDKKILLDSKQELYINQVGLLNLKTSEQLILEVRFRQGGERAHPMGRQHSQKLKKLLQEYKVPPWWRSRIPLFYVDNKLVAVGDSWIELSSTLLEDSEITWQREV